MIRALIVIGLALAVTACVSPRTARGAAKPDLICLELRKQDPMLLQLAAQNWHMVPDEARRLFKSRKHFVQKVRSCSRA